MIPEASAACRTTKKSQIKTEMAVVCGAKASTWEGIERSERYNSVSFVFGFEKGHAVYYPCMLLS